MTAKYYQKKPQRKIAEETREKRTNVNIHAIYETIFLKKKRQEA